MKICLVGPPGVGKTRLIRKLIPGASQISSYVHTDSPGLSEIDLGQGKILSVCEVGDAANRPVCYRDCQGFVILLNCTVLGELGDWLAEIRKFSSAPVVLALDYVTPPPPEALPGVAKAVRMSLEETDNIAAPFLAFFGGPGI